jgi:hypothetical protein
MSLHGFINTICPGQTEAVICRILTLPRIAEFIPHGQNLTGERAE